MSEIESDIDGEVKAKAVAGVIAGRGAGFGMLRSAVRFRVARGFGMARGGSGRAGRVGHGHSPLG